MGIWGPLFGRAKKKRSGLPPEVEAIFSRLHELFSDESRQNEANHPSVRERLENGLDVDQLPQGIGPFGHVAENPIPANGAFGELLYLSLLKHDRTGSRLLFHRIGSVEAIDVYETVTVDGRHWDILFLSMYHPRKSHLAPEGCSLADLSEQPLIFGTNQRLNSFPVGLQEAIRELTEGMIGIPLSPPQVRAAVETVRFVRQPNTRLV